LNFIFLSFFSRDSILYALGIGSKDLRYIYENHAKFSCYPSIPLSMLFKGSASSDVVEFPPKHLTAYSPPIEAKGAILDGERYLEVIDPFNRPLVAGPAKLKMRSRLMSVTNRGSGALAESEIILQQPGGADVVRIFTGAFYVGNKIEGADIGKSPAIKVPDYPSKAPDFIKTEKIPDGLEHIYRLSGDYNPLHIDTEHAQQYGFDKPILHGLCSLGIALRMIMETVNSPSSIGNGNEWLFKSLKCRFAKPVFSGQTFSTEAWVAPAGTGMSLSPSPATDSHKDVEKLVLLFRCKTTGSDGGGGDSTVVINNGMIVFVRSKIPSAKL
jgi:acyl dehydratase